MSLTKLALKIAAPVPEIESFDRFLFIGPHPDDIEIGAGATAAKLAAMGKNVCFLICTDGRYGSESIPPEKLIEIRKAEALASAEALGVTELKFLGLSDGGFYSEKELKEGIARAVGQFKPQVIFAPDPCVGSECHEDHLNVGNAAKKIACFAPYSGIMENYGAESVPVEALAYYMTAKPNRYVKHSKAMLQKQLSAIFDCHKSQFNGSEPVKLYLKLRSADFGLRNFCAHAEGFRVLGITQMHCLPEADI